MKWWKTIMITVLAILLVGVNLFLIIKDNSKVDKTLYVSSWTSAKEQDLEETMVTEGISAPQEEQYVYYDDNKGSFEGFMVKEGEESQVVASFSTIKQTHMWMPSHTSKQKRKAC